MKRWAERWNDLRAWGLMVLAVGLMGAAEAPSFNDFEDVSIIALIANPAAYDGKLVRVKGYLTLRFEGNGLHLDKASFENGLRKNALWVNRPSWLNDKATRRVNYRYAMVEGRFNAREHGHLGLFSGVLEEVRRIVPTYTEAEHRGELQFAWLMLIARWLAMAAPPALVAWLAFRWVRRRRKA